MFLFIMFLFVSDKGGFFALNVCDQTLTNRFVKALMLSVGYCDGVGIFKL